MAGRKRTTDTVPLHELLESLAARIGEEVGRKLAEELARPPERAASTPERVGCSKPGCGKKVAAKGLCKGHYNLMLYHRRKAAGAGSPPPPGRARGRTRRTEPT